MAHTYEQQARLFENRYHALKSEGIRLTPESIVRNGIRNIGFDVDSTLVDCEGVDLLAGKRGFGDEISAMTHNAMNGDGHMHVIFPKRLEIIRPHKKDLQTLSYRYRAHLPPDRISLFQNLHTMGIKTHLISGGYKNAMSLIATELGMGPEDVHANELLFNDKGIYAGFNMEEIPLWTEVGKQLTIKNLKSEGTKEGWSLVGDGMSDYLGSEETDAFIGYGGFVQRDSVRKKASIYINCHGLSPVFVIATGSCRWTEIMKLGGSPARELLTGMRHIQSDEVELRDGFELLKHEVEQFIQF